MEGYMIVDGAAALVVLISAILAYSRGFVRECLSIAGWVVAAIVAFIFAPQVEPLIREIPVISDIIGGSCELSVIAAFAVVFAVTLVVVAVFTPLFSGWIQRSALSGLDQGLGFLFGVARGVLLVLVALVAYSWIVPGDEGIPMVEESKTKEILSNTQTQIEGMIPTEAPEWLLGRYQELTTSCGATPATEESTDTSN